jgi:hypothetical protein
MIRMIQVVSAVLCFAVALLCQSSSQEQSMPSPSAIFHEAHALSSNFRPDDRAVVLLAVANGVRTIDIAACRAWSLELFDVSRRLMASDNRRAMQKNALVTLSSVDPKLSARLFKQQDLPDSDHETYEDNRVFAAGPVFSGLWRIEGRKSLATVRNLANWMGGTGEYPYQAIGEMILELNKNGYRDSAQALFADAEYAYEGASAGYLSTNEAYVSFLLTAYPATNHALLDKGLRSAVESLEHAAEKDKRDIQVQIQNRSGAHAFSSEEDALLYRLIPLLKNVDPDLADSVLHDRKALGTESFPLIGETSTWHGVVSSTQATRSDVSFAFDRQSLEDVLAAKQEDPKRAVLLSDRIATPELRSIALASVLPEYIAVEPSDGKHKLNDIEAQLGSMRPDKLKLELEVTLVGTYLDLHRDADASALAGKAFDLGTELIAEDMLAHPGQYMYTANGMRDLFDLANLMGRKAPQPWSAWQSIEQVQDDTVRAELLASFGKGLLARNPLIPAAGKHAKMSSPTPSLGKKQ